VECTEILEHLYLTYTGTVKAFQSVTEAGKPLSTGQSWRQRGRTPIVVTLGHMTAQRSSSGIATARITAGRSAGRGRQENRSIPELSSETDGVFILTTLS
jgi:hypothetical protein